MVHGASRRRRDPEKVPGNEKRFAAQRSFRISIGERDCEGSRGTRLGLTYSLDGAGWTRCLPSLSVWLHQSRSSNTRCKFAASFSSP